LNDKGREGNSNEQPISAHSFKDVEGSSQQTGIHLIENLHEHEDLEDVCQMEKFLGSGSLWNLLWKEEIVVWKSTD